MAEHKIELVKNLVAGLQNQKNKGRIDQILEILQSLSTLINEQGGSTESENTNIILNKLSNLENKINKVDGSTKCLRTKKPKVIVVKPIKPDEDATEVGIKVKNLIKTDTNINCLNVVVNSNSTRIVLEDDSNEAKVKEYLANSDFKDNIQVETLKPLLPQVS